MRARARACYKLDILSPFTYNDILIRTYYLIDSEPKLPEETDSVTQKDHKWIVCEILRL